MRVDRPMIRVLSYFPKSHASFFGHFLTDLHDDHLGDHSESLSYALVRATTRRYGPKFGEIEGMSIVLTLVSLPVYWIWYIESKDLVSDPDALILLSLSALVGLTHYD